VRCGDVCERACGGRESYSNEMRCRAINVHTSTQLTLYNTNARTHRNKQNGEIIVKKNTHPHRAHRRCSLLTNTNTATVNRILNGKLESLLFRAELTKK